MIVSILLAYLDRAGLRQHFRDVLMGVGAAFVLMLGGGIAAYLLLTSYADSRTQTIFETVTYLLAAVVLTYMTFWMRNHARTLGSELRARTDAALGRRTRWGLGLLSFQAVGREGLETMVFTLAIVFASSGRSVIAGGVAGLLVSLALAFAMYRLGTRIDIALFFRVVGALLLVFAAGILANAVQNLQELGWLPIFARPLWNTADFLSQDSTAGDIVHSFFGYADAPSALQVGVYATYLLVAVGSYLGWRARRPGRQPAAPVPSRTSEPV